MENSREQERIKQLNRLKIALQAVLELEKEMEEKNTQDEQITVTQNQTSKQSTLPIPRARTSRYQRRTARSLSLAARRQRTAKNQLIVSQQQKDKEPDRILVYVR